MTEEQTNVSGKVAVGIINPSKGGFEHMTKGFTLKVPGGRYKGNHFVCDIPEDKVAAIISAVKKRYPYVQFFDPAAEQAEEEETTGKDVTTDGDGAKEGAAVVTPPDKDAFFDACTATKVGTDIWKVTLPDGKEMQIEGVSHHKQAKQAAYEKLYGTSEADEG